MHSRLPSCVPRFLVSFFEKYANLGNPTIDLARCLITSVDAEVRREVESFIFEYYVEKLTQKLGRKLDFDAEKVWKYLIFYFNVFQFKTAYDLAAIHQTSAVIMLPPYFKALGTSEKNKNRQDVVEAEISKLELRARLALEDTAKLIKKHEELFKNF